MFTTKISIFLIALLSLFSLSVHAEDGIKPETVIQLWPHMKNDPSVAAETVMKDKGDGIVRITVAIPSIEYFPATVGKEPRPAILLCPGGGYSILAVSKMTMVAEFLNKHGVSAVILKYRTPKMREEAFNDVQRAMRIVRSHAAEWHINPDQVGILGSSAGGHLAARASTGFAIESYKAIDDIDKISCRPNFTILLYPAYMNKGDKLDSLFTVAKDLAPTLIISARDDKTYFPGSPIYAKALEDIGASVRTHFFDKGGHGFDLHVKEAPLSTWPDLFLKWLEDINIPITK